MADVARTRYVTVLILAVIFVSGVLVGMAVDRGIEGPDPTGTTGAMADADDSSRERRRDDDDRRERRRPIYEQVGIDASQQELIDSIVGEFRDQVEAGRREAWREWEGRWWELVMETRRSIKSVMSPEQAMRYDSLLQASDERGDEDRDGDRRDGGGRD